MPAGLLDRLRRIVPFADKVADEVVSEETEMLEKVIQRMFEVMDRVARFSCKYVRHGRSYLLGLASADHRSENFWWARDRRNRERIDQDDRRLRPGSKCRSSQQS